LNLFGGLSLNRLQRRRPQILGAADAQKQTTVGKSSHLSLGKIWLELLLKLPLNPGCGRIAQLALLSLQHAGQTDRE
jgi:hypothetical protein